MSYIRWSTMVPGQRSMSGTYAWQDCDGGIIIAGRNGHDSDDKAGDKDGMVRLSLPEMLYMCRQFLRQTERWAKDDGVTVEKLIKRWHKGFWGKFDRKHERKRNASAWWRKNVHKKGAPLRKKGVARSH